MKKSYEIIIIGGGHAGIEASAAAANMGCSVALITMDRNAIGRMSCNPAIGGTAKGHLVKEIDALGGLMGRLADRTSIQFRMLNKSKGPAVWSPRCQSDREFYSLEARNELEKIKNLDILEGTVRSLIVDSSAIRSVQLGDEQIFCKCVIIAAGTFLNAVMHVGQNQEEGGRAGESHATGLTEILQSFGFTSGRLKTGTPPRIHKESIDYSILEEQSGDSEPEFFSHSTIENSLPQISCYITYTNEKTHSVLKEGFADSPLFTGRIKGVGPRYCPSIEDKINRFTDKPRHQLFLEPDGLESELIYVNGFSSSLPADIQIRALRTVQGLEKAEMIRAGYAVEYDYFPPHQVELTLETKLINGLYFAGQVNGTSGYEEAAAQGIMAGINAALKVKEKEPLILKRSEAYIGVLIDDLVNKGTDEPYRMFTSRAEYRLNLRQDNADIRLMKYGNKLGLISKDVFDALIQKEKEVIRITNYSNSKFISPESTNDYLVETRNVPIAQFESIAKLAKRSGTSLAKLLELSDYKLNGNERIFKEAVRQAEIEMKYEGYIKRQNEEIERFHQNEGTIIPSNLDYSKIKSLSTESREKLERIRPRSIGQASRISGLRQSDLSILLVYLK